MGRGAVKDSATLVVETKSVCARAQDADELAVVLELVLCLRRRTVSHELSYIRNIHEYFFGLRSL